MKRSISQGALVAAAGLLLAVPAVMASVPPMDGEGKRLESYQNTHEMNDEMRTAMRKKVALYRGMTDREMDMNMHAMGPDYEWYVSDSKVKGPVGLLVLSHGVGENSDRLLKKAWEPMAKRQPTAIGFGMSMMNSAHLQSAVDDLVAHGAKKIVLLDEGTTTRYNTLTRHWQYIFGLYPEASYMDVPKVKAPGVQFIWTGHFDDSPLITDILYDHAMEVAKNPKNSLLLIVGHGPEDMEDNGPDLKILEPHVDRIKAKNVFADVRLINIQDDAIVPVRESNVRKMRAWIQQATKSGKDVIVVAISAASYGVQTHIKTDLRGLKYTFAEKGLAEHPKFIQWAEGLYTKAVADSGARPAPAAKPKPGK
ncbi:MAG: hypothetical protein ABI567_11700 [Gammaproteobacteria bacterium]